MWSNASKTIDSLITYQIQVRIIDYDSNVSNLHSKSSESEYTKEKHSWLFFLRTCFAYILNAAYIHTPHTHRHVNKQKKRKQSMIFWYILKCHMVFVFVYREQRMFIVGIL